MIGYWVPSIENLRSTAIFQPSVQPIECLLSESHRPITAGPFSSLQDFSAETEDTTHTVPIARLLATSYQPIRILSSSQTLSFQATLTSSIWDGGTLSVSFPSDIQRCLYFGRGPLTFENEAPLSRMRARSPTLGGDSTILLGFTPTFEGKRSGVGQRPPTYLPFSPTQPCRKGSIHLLRSMPFPGFEPRPYGIAVSVTIHYTGWACAKIEDEVEKLAYQLNEEAERTERPIRRLSKEMYGSTCADMQVDVMAECLSSIKHAVGTTSGCFYPRSNHWEVGGRPQCDKCGCRVRNCSQHRFTTLETISNYMSSYPGFSSGRPRGTTPADNRYIVLQARRNRRQTAGEIARHTTQATGRSISRFTVARRLHGGGLFARRPVRCLPLTPAHRRRHSLWCQEHRNWRDNEWGRVLFTDESRFSLSSDSHRILIWREREAAIIPRTSLKGTGMEVAVFSFGEASCLVVVQTFTSSTQVQSTGPVIVTRFFFHMCVFFRGAMGLQFLFMDDNAPCHRTVAAEQLLESEDIERMDWPARSPDLNPIEHVWDFLGSAWHSTLPPVTIRELRLALQDEWAAMPQQLIDTLILSMGRRCETCLAIREIISPTKDRMFLAGHP
ncbi:transposable element Tcb2 transposase [Trichonephila clavipes]|nr:transposable element Tcb2 transposase [Trichonephila clavipes]